MPASPRWTWVTAGKPDAAKGEAARRVGGRLAVPGARSRHAHASLPGCQSFQRVHLPLLLPAALRRLRGSRKDLIGQDILTLENETISAQKTGSLSLWGLLRARHLRTSILVGILLQGGRAPPAGGLH